MLIVSGKIYVEAAARDNYLAGCLSVITQARASAGCLDFVLSADPVETDRINVYERWESDADLMKFRGSGPSSQQQQQIRDAHVEKYRISAVEAP